MILGWTINDHIHLLFTGWKTQFEYHLFLCAISEHRLPTETCFFGVLLTWRAASGSLGNRWMGSFMFRPRLADTSLKCVSWLILSSSSVVSRCSSPWRRLSVPSSTPWRTWWRSTRPCAKCRSSAWTWRYVPGSVWRWGRSDCGSVVNEGSRRHQGSRLEMFRLVSLYGTPSNSKAFQREMGRICSSWSEIAP